MITGFTWVALVITGIFFVSFVILFVCAWVIYTRVEHAVISTGVTKDDH